MSLSLEDFTLIPKGRRKKELVYSKKDPRNLSYLYPNEINIVVYAKKMQEFSFYQSLEIAEDLAKRMGCILLPYDCIHWERAKKYGADRKVKIGRKSFFLMKINELTKSEIKKLELYLQEIHQAG